MCDAQCAHFTLGQLCANEFRLRPSTALLTSTVCLERNHHFWSLLSSSPPFPLSCNPIISQLCSLTQLPAAPALRTPPLQPPVALPVAARRHSTWSPLLLHVAAPLRCAGRTVSRARGAMHRSTSSTLSACRTAAPGSSTSTTCRTCPKKNAILCIELTNASDGAAGTRCRVCHIGDVLCQSPGNHSWAVQTLSTPRRPSFLTFHHRSCKHNPCSNGAHLVVGVQSCADRRRQRGLQRPQARIECRALQVRPVMHAACGRDDGCARRAVRVRRIRLRSGECALAKLLRHCA